MKTAIHAINAPRLAVAWWPHFDDRINEHLKGIAHLGAPDLKSLKSNRDEILLLLADKQQHVYYFFCHGDGASTTFRLRVGPSERADTISPSDLNSERYQRAPDETPPLVFLNGCDTIAFKADTINTLMEQFRWMGASGVIGTEIPVHSYLAEDVGRRVLTAFFAGTPLGDVFLDMRRGLIREQLNPLGFAYTSFASAQLHLCSGKSCTMCVH